MYAGLLQRWQPAGPRTVSSTTHLDLFSYTETIHVGAIFLSVCTELSIFSIFLDSECPFQAV